MRDGRVNDCEVVVEGMLDSEHASMHVVVGERGTKIRSVDRLYHKAQVVYIISNLGKEFII